MIDAARAGGAQALRGPLKDQKRMEAHITIPSLQASYKNTVKIGAPSPIKADFVNGVLTLQHAALKGTGTDLQFEGTVPVTSPVVLVPVDSVNVASGGSWSDSPVPSPVGRA